MSTDYKGQTIPEYTDVSDGPQAFKSLVDSGPIPRFNLASDRDLAIPSPVEGMMAWVGSAYQYYTSGGWSPLTAGLAPLNHTHDASAIVTGVIAGDRLPSATTSAYGKVRLNTSVTSTAVNGWAATPSAVKTAYDKGNHAHPYLGTGGGTLGGTLYARHIEPSSDGLYDLGTSTRRWRDIHLYKAGKLIWSNNDYFQYDETNNEWKIYTDGVLTTILGRNASRFSGVMRLYQAMPTSTSSGYAVMSRLDSNGTVIERTSHPDYKANIRPLTAPLIAATKLVRNVKPYVYGEKGAPDEGESTGLLSTEVSAYWPDAIRWDPEIPDRPKGIHYDELVIPIITVLKDVLERLDVLELAAT